MIRGALSTVFVALGLALAPAVARAQDMPPADVDGPADPHGSALPGIAHAALPPSLSEPSDQLPAGVALVRVVDIAGEPVSGAVVRLGIVRNGERVGARELRTRPDGVAQFEHLATGPGIAYRASTEIEGAKFGAMPFQLDARRGERVQLVRLPVSHEPRGILLTEARVEVTFADDRLVVTERATFVNVTTLAIDGVPAQPSVYVPTDGLRFTLPAGYTAFRADDPTTMGDQRVAEEDGAAVVRGSFPPSEHGDGIEVSFQFRVLLDATDIPMHLGFPREVPVISAVVATQAPPGMRLDVAGMPQAEIGNNNGSRILFTRRGRRSREDTPIDALDVRLSGLPASAGPARTLAALVAAAFVLGAIGYAVHSSRTTVARGRDAGAVARERARIEQEARELAAAHARGEVGPETYARLRRELIERLARVLAG